MTTPADPETIANPRAMSGACDRCIHRRPLAGDTHSGCRHPLTAAAHQSPLAGLIAVMGGAIPMPSPPGLTVVFDPHGIRMGWCAWPFNFDPVWLVSCGGFERDQEHG